VESRLLYEKVDAIESQLIARRRELHARPEEGFKEFETSRLIVDWLRVSSDIEITSGVAGTGVIALIRGAKAGPTIGLRVDIDALAAQDEKRVEYASRNAGLCHACGHDVHTVIGLGVARVLAGMRAELKGNVKVIFQPSEESPRMDTTRDADPYREFTVGRHGADLVIEAGALQDPPVDRLLGVHCWPSLPVGQIGYEYGPAMAAAGNFHIVIRGRGGHAARPHQSIDAMPIAAQVILALQTLASRRIDPKCPFVLTIATIKGGTKRFSIADRIDMLGTARGFDEDLLREEVPRRMERLIKGICEGNEGDYEFEYSQSCPPVLNDDRVVRESVASLESIAGLRVVELDDAPMTADDFALYARAVPSLYLKLGTAGNEGDTQHPLHSPLFDVDERCIKIGVGGIGKIMLDFLGQGEAVCLSPR